MRSIMTKNKKTTKNPIWNESVVVTKEDLFEVLMFYQAYNIPVDPILGGIVKKLKAGGTLTLDDQKIVVRSIMSDVAKQTHEAFMHPEVARLAVGCAKDLQAANEIDAKTNKPKVKKKILKKMKAKKK